MAKGNLSRRIIAWLLIAFCGGLLCCILFLRTYLSSRQAAAQVQARLASLYGGVVEVGATNIGISGSSSVNDVTFFDDASKPLLQVQKVRADVGALSLLTGNAEPSALILDGMSLTLRWNKEGRFLAGMPKSESAQPLAGKTLPAIELRNSQVTLVKEGKEDTTIAGIDGTFAAKGDNYAFDGSLRDPAWGDWQITGELTSAAQLVSLTLTTKKPVVIAEGQLRRLAFIPDRTWQHIQVHGTALGKITLTYNLGSGEFHCRGQFEAIDNTVTLPTLPWTATGISKGRVTFDDRGAEMHDLQGKTLGGAVKVSGVVEFGADALSVKLSNVRVTDVLVKELPEAWKFPLRLPGRLDATARFSSVRGAEGLKIDGRVSGAIKLEDEPQAKTEFVLIVRATNKGIQWSSPANEENRELPGAKPEKGAWYTPTFPAGRFVFPDLGPNVLGVFQDAKKPPPPAPAKKGDRIVFKLKMSDVDFEKYAKTLEWTPPFPIRGTLSLDIKTGIPADNLTDVRNYAVTGTVSAKNLRVGGLELETLHAHVEYENGVLSLRGLQAQLPMEGGTLRGSARAQMMPLGKLNTQLSFENVTLKLFDAILAEAALSGAFSGQVQAEVEIAKLHDLSAWLAHGKIASEQLKVYGVILTKGALDMKLSNGLAAIPSLNVLVEDVQIQGKGQVTLKDAFAFAAHLDVPQGQLKSLEILPETWRLPVKIAGAIDATIKASGTLQPFRWSLGGAVKARQVQVYNATLQKVEFSWSRAGETLLISELTGQVYDGQVHGGATIPLAAHEHGKLELQVKGAHADGLARDWKLPFLLAGEVDGVLKGTLTPQKDMPRSLEAVLELSSQTLRFQGVPIETMMAEIRLQKELVIYKLHGKALRGTIDAEGQLPVQHAPKQPLGGGSIKISRINLAQIWRMLQPGAVYARLTGTANLDMSYKHDPETWLPEGKGQLSLREVRWKQFNLMPDLQAEIRLDEGALHFDDVEAKLAGGSARGSFRWDIQAPSRSRVELVLKGARAVQLPLLDDKLSGLVNVKLDGAFGSGNSWYGRGAVEMGDGMVWGLPAQSLRVPFRWRYHVAGHRVSVVVAGASAAVARGRVTGRGTLDWGATLRLDGKLKFTNVELGDIVRDTSSFGQARISGDAILSGDNMHSLADLTGSVRAKLGQNQALTYPILRQVAPFVGQAPYTSFTEGTLRAVIKNETFLVQALSVKSNSLQLFADGQITFSQRVNLNVMARTGQQDLANSRLRSLANQIPAIGPVPTGVLVRATQLLGNRFLYLEVTGTLNSPVVRIQPLRTLTENSVRFFVEQASPTPEP